MRMIREVGKVPFCRKGAVDGDRPSHRSDIDLLRQGQSVIDLNSQITDGTFQLGVPEQQLDSLRFPVFR